MGPAPRPELLSTGQAGFWQRLTRLCGERHDGRMAEGADAQAILHAASPRLRITRVEVVEPSLHDIFVERVTGGASLAGPGEAA